MIAAIATSIVFSATANPGPAPSRPISAEVPISLVTERQGEYVRVRVVGSSGSAFHGRYTLEVQTAPGAGGNRSSHAGRANLVPGLVATFAEVTVGIGEGFGWRARLRVEGDGGTSYEQVSQGE